MKYSRMEKYHNQDNNKEKHLNISNEELNKNLEDLSRHSKKVNKFINAFKFIGIIAIVMIIFTYILYVISDDTQNKNNSSQNETKQTEVVKSSNNKSNYNNNNSITNSEDDTNNTTDSSQNEFSNNRQNKNLQQANNHIFGSLEEAKEYGISCVNKGICSNYSVQNIGNGMYQVILE